MLLKERGMNPETKTKQHQFDPMLRGYYNLLQIPTDYNLGIYAITQPAGVKKKSKIEFWCRTYVFNFFEI